MGPGTTLLVDTFTVEAAVRAGTDTDTVAAIAGALLGARWGCSGIPLEWQRAVNGWPGLTGADLVRLARSHGLDMLGHLLRMAELEAEEYLRLRGKQKLS